MNKNSHEIIEDIKSKESKKVRWKKEHFELSDHVDIIIFGK